MSHWDWNRAAYVLFVLAVFSALVKVSGMTLADSGPTIPRSADAAPAADREPPWYMGTFLKLEADRTPVGEKPPDGGETPPRADSQDAGATSSEAPIFYRPSEPGEATEPVCGNLSDVSESSRVVFPLARAHFSSYSDTWGAPRPQGGHEGTDLMVPAGTPEYALTSGTVVAVSGANESGWNTLGGYTVMIEADNTVGPIEAGDLFYYAHLSSPSELPVGSRVEAGQVVGRAGDTGQGPEITSGLFPAHLHLGWYDGSGGRTEVESGAMNPYPLLEWLKGNGGSVSGGSDASYCEAPQTGGPQPSTGEEAWPAPANPGERPDLDTGSDHARPSPAVERPDPSEDPPEKEAREVRLGTPGADEEEHDLVGEIPEDETPEDETPEGGAGDQPGMIGRIIEDGRELDGLPQRLRERVRALVPDLLPDRPNDRTPRPGDDRDEGRGDDNDPPSGRDENPRNEDPRPEDPPEEDPPDEDEGDGPAEEDQPDEDAGDEPEDAGVGDGPEEGSGGGEADQEEPDDPEGDPAGDRKGDREGDAGSDDEDETENPEAPPQGGDDPVAPSEE